MTHPWIHAIRRLRIPATCLVTALLLTAAGTRAWAQEGPPLDTAPEGVMEPAPTPVIVEDPPPPLTGDTSDPVPPADLAAFPELPPLPPDVPPPATNLPPLLTVPAAQAVHEGQPLTFTVVAIDPDDGQTVTLAAADLPAGATFNAATGAFSWTPTFTQAGDYTLTFTAADDASPSLSDTKTVAVAVANVNQAPLAAAGIDQTVECASPGGTPVTLDASGSSDADGDAVTYEWRENGVTLAGPTAEAQVTVSLGDGAHTLVLVATDAQGAAGTDEVVVTVVDTTPPVIALNGDAEVTVECHLQSYEELGATAGDNCDAAVQVHVAGAPDATTLDTYTVTYTATDAAGNAATPVTRTVRVVDTTAPVVTLLGDTEVTVEAVLQSYTETGATALDACDPAVVVVIGGVLDTAVPDDYVLTYTATDASGNVSQPVTRTVHVVDTTAPSIAAPADLVAEATGPLTTLATLGTPTATDAVGTASVTNDAPSAGFPLGPTVVTWRATDGAGNAATATQTVTVLDRTPPVVTAPPAVIRFEATGPRTAVSIGTAAAVDLVSGAVAVTSNAPDSFAVGATTVTWTATDGAGNTGKATQIVEVVDTTAPELVADLVSPKSSGSGDKGGDKGGGKGDDNGSSGDANTFRVVLSSHDLVDPQPTIQAYITQPVTGADVVDVRFQRDRRNLSIAVQAQRRGVRVTLTGPDEAALRRLWGEAVARGGFIVVNDQVVKLLDLQDRGSGNDDRSGDDGNVLFVFDSSLRLAEAHTRNPVLVAVAKDLHGNASAAAQVQPPYRWRRAAKLATPPEAVLQDGLQAYPNPFNSSTQIAFEVTEAGPTSIVIYNMMGQQVRELVNEFQVPGFYQAAWDGRDGAGREAASGVYIYRLTTASGAISQRFTLLR
ncbi:MAG: immunoglobulin-like domain-containing protein [Gemmatimonadota bacterium]